MTGRDWSRIQALIAELVDMLAGRHPAGIRILMGQATPPDSQGIAELLDDGAEDPGVRIDGGRATPYAEACLMRADPYLRAVETAGGWEHLTATVREYAEACPREWGMFREHVAWIRRGGAAHTDGARLERIGRKYGVSGITVRRRREEVPGEIARLAVVHPPEGFRLVG